jgi:hypothetical protein
MSAASFDPLRALRVLVEAGSRRGFEEFRMACHSSSMNAH